MKEAGHKRTKTGEVHLYKFSRGVRSRDRKWMVGPGAGGGDGESVFHGDRISVWEVEKVLEMDSGDECTVIRMYLMLLMVKMVNFMYILP